MFKENVLNKMRVYKYVKRCLVYPYLAGYTGYFGYMTTTNPELTNNIIKDYPKLNNKPALFLIGSVVSILLFPAFHHYHLHKLFNKDIK